MIFNRELPSYLYLNLDTQLRAIDVDGWYPEKMGVSIAVALTSKELRIFTAKNINELIPLLESAKAVIGYNLEGFDFRVLCGCPGVNLEGVRYLDMLADIESSIGVRVSFGAAVIATLGAQRDDDGLDLVKCWKEGKIEKVIEGVTSTALQIRALHEYGMEHGEVFYNPHESNRRVRVAVDWAGADAIRNYCKPEED